MAADDVRDSLRQTPEYIRYQEKERELLRVPGLKAGTDELRRELYELYADEESRGLVAKTETVREKYSDLLSRSEVTAYLRAEAAYLRRVRQVLTDSARASDIRSPF